ncbi:MAG: tetratricopeptide repeat protein [Candidatus Sumerlaeota bacterium]|nr:tetratricopeptide repeat protein [Candidatus Sumerlaeota bacterium]
MGIDNVQANENGQGGLGMLVRVIYRIFLNVLIGFLAMPCSGCMYYVRVAKWLHPDSAYDTYLLKGIDAQDVEDYGQAERFYLMAGKELRRKGDPTWYPCDHLASVYENQGRYAEAVAALDQYLRGKYPVEHVSADSVDSITPLLDQSVLYQQRGRIRQAQGQYEDALRCFETASEKHDESLKVQKILYDRASNVEERRLLEEGYRDNAENYAYRMNQLFGRYWLELGEFGKAKKCFEEELQHCMRRDLHRADFEGRAKLHLGMVAHYSGNDEEAEGLVKQCIGANARSIAPWVDDLVTGVSVLGRIMERSGVSDKAIQDYQRLAGGLEAELIREGKRTLPAAVSNVLARWYFRRGDLAESSASYEQAMRLRRETVTQTHPDYADSLKGLADIAASENDLTSATLQAKQALAVLDASVVPTHPRTAQVLVALDALYTLTGHPEEAAPLRQRLDTILEQPLGIRKEDFLLTVDFYAGLLEKKGKAADAKRLRDLHIRQKDRK